MSLPRIPKQREIVDRRKLAEAVAQAIAEQGAQNARQNIVELLRDALANGRKELTERLSDKPNAGHEIANGFGFLVDQVIRVIHDHVVDDLYPVANRSTGERLVLLAVGGYGRYEMSPHSDVDLAFITPSKPTSWCEQVIEAILYYLWDLGLTIGHSSRSVDEMVRMAKDDLTIRTSLLEGRYLWGDQELYDLASARFYSDVVSGSENQFIAEKMAERDARHKRMGDSRYVVEPNVKDGKGALRDLQTLYWMGKYLHRVKSAAELVEKGLFSQEEYQTFRRAERFLLAVRAHLHTIAKRGEDRLTFDLQREVAKRMHYADRPGKSAVERFMQFYFLQVQQVGHLTGVFLAHLEEETESRNRVVDFFSSLRPGKKTEIEGFVVENDRISAPEDDWFQSDPVRLIEIYTIAEREGLEIHPNTSRIARRDANLINKTVRRDARANALFLDVLCGRNDPEKVLRWMSEAGIFGRFIPDFGKVGGQMQFDMYHHYTVDEHTIRAIGLLSRIERGELAEDHPLASAILPRLGNRRIVFVSTLLHDIAKGRGGDHTILGAEVALKLCPRLGMSTKETELVAWLVRYHLLMSATAFKRDLSDPKTIQDFVAEVHNMEHLRQLTALTIVDIRAVGPGIWNSWKRQLLSELYDNSEEIMRLGHKSYGREQKIAEKKANVARILGDKADLVVSLADRFDDAYWIAEPDDIIALNLLQYGAARDLDRKLSIHTEYYPALGATLVSVIGNDHPGLFSRISGAIHLAGGNIIDARIHTNGFSKAVDNFLVQDPLGKPFSEPSQLKRLKTSIEDALAGKIDMLPSLEKRPLARSRAEHFRVQPTIFFDNNASNRFTVIEVNATVRPALLYRLTLALFDANVIITSAHITQYGERAVDTFYVTDLFGEKLDSKERIGKLEAALFEAIAASEPETSEKMATV